MSSQQDAEVLDFVIKNKVRAKRGFICVDGRYAPGKYSGMLARPGGNFRGIMVLLALRKRLKLTVGQIVDQAVNAVEAMGIPFSMHTDTHHHEDEANLGDIGCGHIGKAEDPKSAPDYKVDPVDVHNALIYLRIKLEGKRYYELQELNGDHKEKGTLIITGTKYTVNHWDKKTGEMYFVFDKARDDLYTQQLYENFKFRFPRLTFKEFKQLADIQLDATLKHLAKGMPIYEVNLDGKEPQVKFVGKVS